MSDEEIPEKYKAAALRWALTQARQHARKWAKAADPSHSLGEDEQRLTTGLSDSYDRHVAALHHLVQGRVNMPKGVKYFDFFPKAEYDAYLSQPSSRKLSYSEWVGAEMDHILGSLKFDEDAEEFPHVRHISANFSAKNNFARFEDAALHFLNMAAKGGPSPQRLELRDSEDKLVLCIDTAFDGKLKLSAHELADGSKLLLSVNPDQAAWLRAIRIVNRGVWNTDSFMVELLDFFTCNSDYGWVSPVETGDLTDAPILGRRDEDGKVTDRWAFMNYQIENFLDTLADEESVTFYN